MEIRLELLPKLPGATAKCPVSTSWKRARATGALPLPPCCSPLPTLEEEKEVSKLAASVPAASAACALNPAAAVAGGDKRPCEGTDLSRTLSCCCPCISRAPHVTSAGDASTAAALTRMPVDRREAGVRTRGLPSRRARMKMFSCLFAQCPLPLCTLPDSKVMCPCQIPWLRYACSSPVCVCLFAGMFVCVCASSSHCLLGFTDPRAPSLDPRFNHAPLVRMHLLFHPALTGIHAYGHISAGA